MQTDGSVLLTKYVCCDGNCLFCSLSCSWFHSLQTKPTIPYLPPPFLYPPLDLASAAGLILSWSKLTVLISRHLLCLPQDLAPAAGLIPYRSKPTVSYPPPPLFVCPLPLLSPKCYLRPDPRRKAAATFFFSFSQPATLLIKLLDMR
jgi:hypothetical protein